jgi:hypothetical protein
MAAPVFVRLRDVNAMIAAAISAANRDREKAMPLTRASERPVLRPDEIRFLMSNGANEVICNISLRVLLALGASVGMTDTRDIFRTYRDQIERAASGKYDRSAREQYEILDVEEGDF